MSIQKVIDSFDIDKKGQIPTHSLKSILRFLRLQGQQTRTFLQTHLDPQKQGTFSSQNFIKIYNQKYKKQVQQQMMLQALITLNNNDTNLTNLKQQQIRRMFKIFDPTIKEQELKQIIKRVRSKDGKIYVKDFIRVIQTVKKGQKQ